MEAVWYGLGVMFAFIGYGIFMYLMDAKGPIVIIKKEKEKKNATL